MNVDKYGVICNQELVKRIDKLAEQFDNIVEDLKLDPVETRVAQCVLVSTVGFLAASRSVKMRIKDNESK